MLPIFKSLALVSISLLSLSMSRTLRPLQRFAIERAGFGRADGSVKDAACPTITIDCPIELIEPGESFTVVSNVSGADPGLNLTYNWSINAGTITSGQGTPSITVKYPAPQCLSLTATVEVGGLDSSCQKTASCSVIPPSPPVSRKFDQYGDIDSRDERARLESFAAQLNKEPGAKGYIVFYSRRHSSGRKVERRANRDRLYLVNTNKIEYRRLIAVKGGEREELTMELWISPQGAPTPPDFKSRFPKCSRQGEAYSYFR